MATPTSALADMSETVPGDDERIPLGWVRKWVGKRVANIVKIIDTLPQNIRHDAQWLMLRTEARNALSDIDELQKLAAWLDKPALKNPLETPRKIASKTAKNGKIDHKNGKKSLRLPTIKMTPRRLLCPPRPRVGRHRGMLPRGNDLKNDTNGR